MSDNDIPYAQALEGNWARLLNTHFQPIAPEAAARACGWLAGLDFRAVGLWVRNTSDLQHPDVIRGLLQTAYAARLHDVQLCLALSEKAVRVADALHYPVDLRPLECDLKSRAYCMLANSLRLMQDHRAAEHSLRSSERYRRAGSGDPALAGEVETQRAALRRAQRRFGRAVVSDRRAADHFREAGALHRAGKAHLSEAVTHFDAGDPWAALDAAAEAAELIDVAREPEMGFALLHNSLFFLEAAGQPQLASLVMPKVDPLYAALGSPLVQLRAWWLKGRLLLAQGTYAGAASYFDATRKGFAEHGLLYDAALSGFDAARAYAHLHQPARVEHIARQMVEVFTAKEIPRAARAAFKLFLSAAKTWRADVALFSRLAEQLAKAPKR